MPNDLEENRLAFTPIPLCNDDDNDFVKIDAKKDIFNNTYSIFNEFRMSAQLCDVSLIIDGKRLYAHKVILAAVIPYFRGMFTLDLAEANMKEIKMSEIDYDTMEQLIGYAYTGEIRISTSNVQTLMIGANFLQLLCVFNNCTQFLISRLHSSNCLSIRDFCRTLCCSDETMEKINVYLMKHFLAISKDKDFLNLSVSDIIEILKFDGLYVDSEEDVFNCAIEWLKFDESRHVHASRVLSCIRLPILSPSFLSVSVATNPILKRDLSCRDLIDEAKDYHLIPERRAFMNSFVLTPRSCPDIPCLLVAIGGLMHPSESRSSVEIYDPISKKWTPIKQMVTLRTRVGVAVHRRQVYAIGGFNGHDRLKLVEVFDYDTNVWKKTPPLSRKRSALAAAFVGEKLFVCGGYDGVESLSSVEIYEIEKETWKDGPEMQSQRSAAGIAVIDNCVYVCGGHDGMQIFSTVEKLEVETRTWCKYPPMLSKRCRFGATAYKGKIYVAGGYDGNMFLKSVEVFDPETMQWSYRTPMNIRRSRVALVAGKDRLYAVAGFDGENNLCSMEEYDETNDTWTLSTPLATHEGGVGVGIVPIPPSSL